MRPVLPAAMVARLEQRGMARRPWARAPPAAPVAAHAAAVLAVVRAALPDLLHSVVQLTTTDLDPGIAAVQRRCPGCARRVPLHESRDRTVHTTCGRLSFQRPWYHCPACQHGCSPADTTLALPPRARRE